MYVLVAPLAIPLDVDQVGDSPIHVLTHPDGFFDSHRHSFGCDRIEVRAQV